MVTITATSAELTWKLPPQNLGAMINARHVRCDGVDVGQGDVEHVAAVGYSFVRQRNVLHARGRLVREADAVLDAVDALLLDGNKQRAFRDDGGGAIMPEVDAEVQPLRHDEPSDAQQATRQDRDANYHGECAARVECGMMTLWLRDG